MDTDCCAGCGPLRRAGATFRRRTGIVCASTDTIAERRSFQAEGIAQPRSRCAEQSYTKNYEPAEREITIYHSDSDPIGPYSLKVDACRVRHVRFNDLIDPQAIPLDRPYAAVIRSSVPVLVQVTRHDTSKPANALMTLAFPVDD